MKERDPKKSAVRILLLLAILVVLAIAEEKVNTALEAAKAESSVTLEEEGYEEDSEELTESQND